MNVILATILIIGLVASAYAFGITGAVVYGLIQGAACHRGLSTGQL